MPDLPTLDALRARLDALAPPRAGPRALRLPNGTLPLGRRTLIMGIINVTPDSFSGDGLGGDVAVAIARGRQLIADGADILDVGGESTRPGAEEVSVSEEIRRVVPVIEGLARDGGMPPISIDTCKPEVARAALAAGATIVNDITGLQRDPRMARIASEHGAPVVAMHILGSPKTMQQNPTYRSLIPEIAEYLAVSVETAVMAGVPRDQVVVDPGIGFGKTLQHNLELIRKMHLLRALGQPLLIGTSRKAFIGRILGGLPPAERVEGTMATCVLAAAAGVDIVRVHDVGPIARALRVADAVVRGYEE